MYVDNARCYITSTYYCDLLQQYIIPSLQEQVCLETTVLMQDDAPRHRVGAVMGCLRGDFEEDRAILRTFRHIGLLILWNRIPETSVC